MPTFSSHGFQIHFEDIPHAAPENVIFLHGNVSSNVWWHPTVAHWKKCGDKSLLLMEWRGSGKSQGPNSEADLEMEKLASDVITLAERCSGSPNLVGHSTGGLIALLALAKRPDLFRKAVLLDSVGAHGLRIGPEVFTRVQELRKSKELCGAAILNTIYGEVKDKKLAQEIVDSAFGVHPLNWHGVLNALKDKNFEAQIRTIPHPVLVLHGEHDLLLPQKDSEHLAEILPRGEFREIPNHGHCTNVEDPNLFAEIAQGFLFGG